MEAHYQGLGQMERYEYPEAVAVVSRGQQAGTGVDTRVNQPGDRALERHGVKAEEAKKAGASLRRRNFDESLELLADVLERDRKPVCAFLPRHHLSSRTASSLIDANRHFKRVTRSTPTMRPRGTGMARTVCGSRTTLRVRRAGSWRQKQIPLFQKALALDPI